MTKRFIVKRNFKEQAQRNQSSTAGLNAFSFNPLKIAPAKDNAENFVLRATDAKSRSMTNYVLKHWQDRCPVQRWKFFQEKV